MVETRWWDTFLIQIRCGDHGVDVRVGLFCLLVLVWMAIRTIRWLTQEDGPKTTT